MTSRVLIVDDDDALCRMLEMRLAKRGYAVAWRTSANEALELIEGEDFDVVVTDLNMEAMDGIELCERIAANRPNVPVVVITAFGSLETAIEAIRGGAYDFITKPFEIDQLDVALKRAVQHRRLGEEVRRLQRRVDASQRMGKLHGASEPMKKLFDMIERVAESDATVLLSGESGTGKELAARELHERSRRSGGPFVAVSCAAVPDNLLESELFGHERGAFTDAKAARRGLFLQAGGGTLFLDEIGDMPAALQPKILRALQEKAVRPVGGGGEVGFDARIIAATNRDLESLVEEGKFRDDLFYRINVVHIALPPLRSRGSDILLLAKDFIEGFAAESGKKVSGLAEPVAARLLFYHWPGNVRELRNCMERAVALARFDRITVDDLPEKIRDYKSSHIIVAGTDPAELVSMEEVERRYILRVLEAAGGNKTTAARILGLDRRTLYRKLERYGPGDGAKKDR